MEKNKEKTLEESAMDKSFSGLFGGSPRAKVLEFLLLSRGNFEYHLKDISDGSGISRPTCQKEVASLKELGVVKKGKKWKGKQLYKLNTSSHIADVMLDSLHRIIYNN